MSNTLFSRISQLSYLTYFCTRSSRLATFNRNFEIMAGTKNSRYTSISSVSEFTDIITADGSSGFPAESGRYHIYAALACPFAARALIIRKLKGLEEVLPVTICDWYMENGWKFTDQKPRCTLDTVNNCQTLKEIYQLVKPEYSGRVTVPVLWDKKTKQIMCNDSAILLRMLGVEFNAFCKTEEQRALDLYPAHLQEKIDEVNSWVAPNINLGVYGAGFAKNQEDYDKNVTKVFEHLDKAEAILSKQRYLTGNELTEADIRLFASLVRFDLVYVTHFKCNKRRLADYSALSGFMREIYQIPGIADTVDRQHITNTYYTSHKFINPYGIVPIGPDQDLNAPHNREKLST